MNVLPRHNVDEVYLKKTDESWFEMTDNISARFFVLDRPDFDIISTFIQLFLIDENKN